MSRIVFFVSSMQGGGAERVAALLCNEWVDRGHEVVLVPTFSGRGVCKYPLSEPVRLVFLADRIGTTKKNVATQIQRFWEVRQLVREYRADVVVSFLPRVNVSVIFATLGMGLPVVVSERTYPPMARLGFFVEKARGILYAKAAAVVVQTQQTLNWLRSASPRARGMVIANPLIYPVPAASPVLDPAQLIGADQKLLLAVGRLGHVKGFDLLLRSFAEVAPSNPDWQLVILGEGDERESLEALCADHKLDDRVVMPGVVGNVCDWYDRADLFVLSSRFEGFPNSLLEAMAHGVAVVSFACDTGPAEIIEHDRNGVLVPPENGVDGLAQALNLLMRDKHNRTRLGAEATAVRERYQAASIAAQWETLFSPRR